VLFRSGGGGSYDGISPSGGGGGNGGSNSEWNGIVIGGTAYAAGRGFGAGGYGGTSTSGAVIIVQNA